MTETIFITCNRQVWLGEAVKRDPDGRWPRSYWINSLKFKLRLVRFGCAVYTQIEEVEP